MRFSEKREPPGKLLQRAFFEAPPERVARRLLGKVLARRSRAGWLAGRIVEAEAYLGPHEQTADPAAHSHRGPTPRNQVLFGPAGHAYVYFIYGLYFCMNVSCEREGHGGGVLIRALEPVAGFEQMARNRGLDDFPRFPRQTRNGWGAEAECSELKELTGGPGRLCQALGITRNADNGLDLVDSESPLQLRDDGTRAGRVVVTPRIGIRHAADLPLRFAIAGNGCVSGPKLLNRSRIFPNSHSVR
ncbi:MAG: DNA-3-methyladenine glycosylase [Terracidiphilus sp.]